MERFQNCLITTQDLLDKANSVKMNRRFGEHLPHL